MNANVKFKNSFISLFIIFFYINPLLLLLFSHKVIRPFLTFRFDPNVHTLAMYSLHFFLLFVKSIIWCFSTLKEVHRSQKIQNLTVPNKSYTSTYTRYGMYSRERRLQRTDLPSVRKPGKTRELITLDKLVFIRVIDAGSIIAPFFDNALKSAQFAIIVEIVFFYEKLSIPNSYQLILPTILLTILVWTHDLKVHFFAISE